MAAVSGIGYLQKKVSDFRDGVGIGEICHQTWGRWSATIIDCEPAS